jgi:tetraacyldisaccharide 4'-kinase
VDPIAFPDHHRYTTDDVAAIRHRVGPGVRVVCTLKDAVKLGPLWPREAEPMWYVSQRVDVERGVEAARDVLDAIYRPRPTIDPSRAASAG